MDDNLGNKLGRFLVDVGENCKGDVIVLIEEDDDSYYYYDRFYRWVSSEKGNFEILYE